MIYADVPGGSELLSWFGEVPTFHNAEILSLHLDRTGTSEIKLHGWIMIQGVDANGHIVLDKQAVVTFTLDGIMDLQLEGFSAQNVIAGLVLQRATDRDRSGHFSLPQDAFDIEIELLPSFGLSGFIRAKKVAISFVPGAPSKG